MSSAETSSSENFSKEAQREPGSPGDSDKDDSTSTEDEFEVEVPEEETVENPLLDSLIYRLMTAKSCQRNGAMSPQQANNDAISAPRKQRIEAAPIIPVSLSFEELTQLCDLSINAFLKQKSLLRFKSKDLPLVIVGDLHGQFRDLRSIFTRCGAPQIQTYLFLGDYVDRGVQGIEVITLLFALKCKYPTKVFMLRGNHEDGNTCMSYGFYDEIMERFLLEEGGGDVMYKKFLSVFNCIPLAALIDDKVLAMHGGISPHITAFEDIETIQRPAIIPPYGIMCDLLWADPDALGNEGWGLNPRGISFTFSSSILEDFCRRLGLDLVVRAHQLTGDMLKNGYRFFANGRLVTVFSAPNYLNMKNDSAVLRITKKLHCRFLVFRTQKRVFKAPKPAKPPKSNSKDKNTTN